MNSEITTQEKDKIMNTLNSNVYVKSEQISDRAQVKGYDFNKGLDYGAVFASLNNTGFQATNLGNAIDEINGMIKWRLSDDEVEEDETEHFKDPEVRKNTRCTIFLGYTSNMSSCGMREYIKYLCEHKMIDCIVTTTGGVEEDFMKVLAPHYIGDFALDGKTLRDKGINRIGNLLVPNKHYEMLEQWFTPLVKELHEEQQASGNTQCFTPSEIINRMGKKLEDDKTPNREDSVYYWCWKNDIPVFCPAFTDGALGDVCYFYSYNQPGFIIDICRDLRKINDISLKAKKSGQIIIGGGVIKHHINNANLMRNGANFSVFINTAQEFDGSDAGARPDEAVSWGKISKGARAIKVYAEATLVLPIIIGETFVRNKDLAKRN